MNLRFFSKPDSEKGASKKETVNEKFKHNLLPSVALAAFSIPFESAAVKTVIKKLDNPNAKVPFLQILRDSGLKGATKGAYSRVFYCLWGQYLNLWGLEKFGTDVLGVAATTTLKNFALPPFVISNARQNNYNLRETIDFFKRTIKCGEVHAFFWGRNFAGNMLGLVPGIYVRDYLYQANGQKDTALPTFAGWSAALVASTIMNSFLKPWFTGSYSVSVRLRVALQLPAWIEIAGREGASLAISFLNMPFQKKEVAKVDGAVTAAKEPRETPSLRR